MQSTTVILDWGVVATALAPSLMIAITAIVAAIAYRRTRREDKEERARIAKLAADTAAELKKQGHETHVLVNDQLTREKAARLLAAETHRVVLLRALGDDLTVDEVALLANLDVEIKALAAEIRQRDVAAGTLIEEEEEGPLDGRASNGVS